MANLLRALVLVAVLHVTTSIPLLKRRQKKESPLMSACDVAVDDMGEVLRRADFFMPSFSPYTMREVVEYVAARQIYDGAFRYEILCRLEGLTTLSELLEALDDLDLDFALVRAAYSYVVGAIDIAQHELNASLVQGWQDDDEREKVQLLDTLVGTGFTVMDQDVTEFVTPLLALYYQLSSGQVYEPQPVELSQDTQEQQCSTLTNDFRVQWNRFIRREEEWNPDASRDIRRTLRRWTGIELSSHDSIKAKVCQTLAVTAFSTNGVRGLLDVIKLEEIQKSLLKQAYPELVLGAHHLKQYLEAGTSGSYGGYGGGYGGDYSGSYGGSYGGSYPYPYYNYGTPDPSYYNNGYSNYNSGNKKMPKNHQRARRSAKKPRKRTSPPYYNYYKPSNYGSYNYYNYTSNYNNNYGYGGDYSGSNGYGGSYPYPYYNYGTPGPNNYGGVNLPDPEFYEYALRFLNDLYDMGVFSLMDDLEV